MTVQIEKQMSGNCKDMEHDSYSCVQCGYCSSCCEVSFISKDSPRKVIRYLQRNDMEGAVMSPFLMLCKQCQTCSLICPQNVDIAQIMRELVLNRFLTY